MAFVLSAPPLPTLPIRPRSTHFNKPSFRQPQLAFSSVEPPSRHRPLPRAITGPIELDFGDEEDDDGSSPWEGALVYRRNSAVTHLEYGTTLERLGLTKLSGELSVSRASAMGLRLSSSSGTPVLVSVDVTKKKRKLRLDGVLRTVILLGCNRCGGPATKSVFSNFSLLLTEDPIEEEEEIDLGTIFGSEKTRVENDDDDDDDDIEMEDRIFFPAEEKAVDISKNIRDLVHLEITINALCDPTCKGLCLSCGTNLNQSVCRCKNSDGLPEFGPLSSLKQQINGRR